jgi:HemY protein
MVRALIFLLKVGVLVAGAVWIADRQGTVNIAWDDYSVSLQTGFFIFIALAVIMLAIFFYWVIQTFTGMPRSLRRYIGIKRQAAGYKSLAAGLAAVAAGDTRTAVKHASLVRKYLPRDQGLPLLLQAQTERLQGHEERAQDIFQQLTHHKDAGFLGVRGLLQAAMDRRDYTRALDLARQASQKHPHQGWILKLVYDLEIRQREWAAAHNTLKRAEKAGAMTHAEARKDSRTLFMARAEECLAAGDGDQARIFLRDAVKVEPGFVPASVALARAYVQGGQIRAAVKVIEQAWRVQPHPDLEKTWQDLLPLQKARPLFSRALSGPLARLAWTERLVVLNPQHAESHLAAGIAAASESLWGEARDHFRKAELIEPSGRLYKNWIALERRTGVNPRVVEALQDKYDGLVRQERSERRWVCYQTGRVYDEWVVLAPPHGSFNTIEWTYPGSQLGVPTMLSVSGPMPGAHEMMAGSLIG